MFADRTEGAGGPFAGILGIRIRRREGVMNINYMSPGRVLDLRALGTPWRSALGIIVPRPAPPNNGPIGTAAPGTLAGIEPRKIDTLGLPGRLCRAECSRWTPSEHPKG